MEQDKTLELLEEMRKINKKTLMHQRVMTVLMIVFVVCVVSLLPSVTSALDMAKETLVHTNEAITKMETALESIQGLADEASATMDGMDTALEKVNNIDIETLNGAITDLSEVIEPLAEFFGRFN